MIILTRESAALMLRTIAQQNWSGIGDLRDALRSYQAMESQAPAKVAWRLLNDLPPARRTVLERAIVGIRAGGTR